MAEFVKMFKDAVVIDDSSSSHPPVVTAGIFTFENDTPQYFLIEGLPKFQLERLDENTARLFFVNASGTEVPVPKDVRLVNSYHTTVPRVAQSFIVTWIEESYTLFRGNSAVFMLRRQRQANTHLPTGAKHGHVVREEATKPV